MSHKGGDGVELMTRTTRVSLSSGILRLVPPLTSFSVSKRKYLQAINENISFCFVVAVLRGGKKS